MVVGEVVARHRPEARELGLRVDTSLAPASTFGDRRLIERLASNLVENALRYNAAGGEIRVAVQAAAGVATLAVCNTGPPVAAGEVDRLIQPFERSGEARAGHDHGVGLGLSIVAAIAAAHDAALDVQPREGGGLEVTVRFAASPAAGPAPADQPTPADQPAPALSAD